MKPIIPTVIRSIGLWPLLVVLPAHAGPYADYLRALPALPAALSLPADADRLTACDEGAAADLHEAANAALAAEAEAQARGLTGGAQAQLGAAVASDEAMQQRLQAQAAAIAALPPAERMKAMMQLASAAQNAAPAVDSGQTFGPIESPATQCLTPLRPDLEAVEVATRDLQRQYADLRQRAASARVPCPFSSEADYGGRLPPACTDALWKKATIPYADGATQLVTPYWRQVQPRLARVQTALTECVAHREQAEADAIRAGAIRPNNLAMTRFTQASLETLNRYTQLRARSCEVAQPAVLASRWRDPQYASWGYVEDASGQLALPSAFSLSSLP